jgi:hypothetical protein
MPALAPLYGSPPLSTRQRYLQLKTALWTERSSFDQHWRDLGDYLLPRRTRFWTGDRNKGDKRNQLIIDSTGRFAVRTLQSGLHAGLTSPARPWFKLTTPDPEMAAFKPVEGWLVEVTRRMQVIFADSNLYNVLPVVYGDMGVFGTGAMSVLEDSKDLLRCYAYPIGSYAIALDSRGLAATFVREYELSVEQVVETFGVRRGYRDIDWSRFSVSLKHAWEHGQYQQPVSLCWVVVPNRTPTRGLGPEAMPWLSYHLEVGADNAHDGILRESGFASFPILVPRWDVTGEDSYGTDCPGMTALGDVRQLQVMQRRKAQAIQKMIDPPLVGSAELRTQKTSLLPGDITYVRDPQYGLRSIHEVSINLEHLVRDMAETQYRIQRAFYEDLFLMLARSDEQLGADRPTAREIEERHEEKLLALGPVLERTNDELLDPLIDRTYLLMERAGLLPEPPEDLHGVGLKVEYISIMAQAQQLVGVVGQDRFLGSVAPLVQIYPEVRHKVNVNRVVDRYAAMLGVDPAIVRSDEEAAGLAGEEASQQRALAEAQQAQMMAKAVKDAGQAPVAPDSALDRVLGNAAPGLAGVQ